jgi:hypothetical protein
MPRLAVPIENSTIMLAETSRAIMLWEKLTPINEANARKTMDSSRELNVGERAFPTTIENRETGATSIRLRIPRSNSHFKFIPYATEVSSTVFSNIPGNINCW